jgi:hypothetical protein
VFFAVTGGHVTEAQVAGRPEHDPAPQGAAQR